MHPMSKCHHGGLFAQWSAEEVPTQRSSQADLQRVGQSNVGQFAASGKNTPRGCVRTMSKRPSIFRQSDLKRALRAAKGAGIEVKQIEIDPTTGKITMITGDPKKAGDESGIVANWRASRACPA
jgi:hypothetical protein